MNWDAIGAMREPVGAGAVVMTLIYLSVQMRQNTQALRINSAQAVTEELQNMFSLLASDQTLAEIFAGIGAIGGAVGAPSASDMALPGRLKAKS